MVWNNQTAQATSTSVDAGLRSYMNRVYTLMSMGIGLTGIVTYIVASVPSLLVPIAMGPMKWVLFAAVLGLGWFAPQIIMTKSRAAAGMAFWVYSALWGAMMAPMIAYFLQTQQGAYDIAYAFFTTSIMFAGASLYGYATKRDLSVLGRFFMMAMIGLIVAMVANIFIGSGVMSLGISVLVVLVSAGITAYETQMIRNMYYQLPSGGAVSRFAILGAFMLYGTFVSMFIHILNIMAAMRR
ncbi:MAG: Bax inhibitor-1/YccA family protein [Alphaproteobacteria bacterium]